MNQDLRNATKSITAPALEAPHEVVCRVRSKTIPSISTGPLALLLCFVDFLLELVRARVDELELGELRIEYTDDLGQLK